MAVSLKFRLKNIENLTKKFNSKTVTKAVKEGITKGMLRIEAHAKDPILSGEILKVRTGTLKARTHSEVQTRGSRIVGILKNNTKYARIHEFGGTIKPKRGEFLVFQPAGAGHLVMVREVKIPARKPFRTAILAKRKEVIGDIETALKRRLG